MSYPAFDEITGSAPSPTAISRRIRKAREELDWAETRLKQQEYAAAIRRLDRAATEARGGYDIGELGGE